MLESARRFLACRFSSIAVRQPDGVSIQVQPQSRGTNYTAVLRVVVAVLLGNFWCRVAGAAAVVEGARLVRFFICRVVSARNSRASALACVNGIKKT